ncbi:hypothetical protein PFNF54_02402 [Plasmodium falciparum NF54]|nr:hypothetical protein PFNF54_02402 [Plasmodium falciparum NF54]
MKEVMENFIKQTQQRFHDYDDRMKEKRKQCKERCDKEIQKIILKDKLEKELTEKFSTLHTDIQSDAIPTCVCEKSVADKVEKTCLRCGSVFGGGIAPSVGLLGGIGEAAISAWKPKAIAAAIAAAEKAGAAEGLAAGNALGMEIVTAFLKAYSVDKFCPELLQSIGNKITYYDVAKISEIIIGKYEATCNVSTDTSTQAMCTDVGTKFKLIRNETMDFLPTRSGIKTKVIDFVEKAKFSADTQAAKVSSKITADLTAEKTGEIAATYGAWKTTIIASIVAIVVIVLIMVIIYLILRYRRKKKMKKKLQYIKLLKE